MQKINYEPKKLLETVSESDRNFYNRTATKIWSHLKSGKSLELLGKFSDTGWVLVFAKIDSTEYQLTKKQIRASDLKYYFGGN